MIRGNLRIRILVGPLMALVALGVLLADGALSEWIAHPFYPCLFLFVLALTVAGAVELCALTKAHNGPPLWLLLPATLTVFLANWPAHLKIINGDVFRHVLNAVTVWVLIAFMVEMARYRPGGGAVTRMSLFALSLAYIGVLPVFLVQMRFGAGVRGVGGVAAVIAVTKCCDVGAYFAGRLFGYHPMTPLLSPKKTWEGFAGGMLASVGTAVVIHHLLEGLFTSLIEASMFGAVIGLMGVLGDLAESLVKREGGAKDASNVVPGFGGILDVVDSIIFAAPVAYWWLG